jgi:hypothetical protein
MSLRVKPMGLEGEGTGELRRVKRAAREYAEGILRA